MDSFEEMLNELIDEQRELGMSVEEIAEWLRAVLRSVEDEYE